MVLPSSGFSQHDRSEAAIVQFWGLGITLPDSDMKLSARNQLAGKVIAINHGEAIANVELDVAGQRLVASVTVEAVQELGLKPGSEVLAVIKASDVIVATP
jgi:molybdopterin-binding protein